MKNGCTTIQAFTVLKSIYCFSKMFFSSTILIEPNWFACVKQNGDIIIQMEKSETKKQSRKENTELDTTELSIFSHRFMSIAEQMGR